MRRAMSLAVAFWLRKVQRNKSFRHAVIASERKTLDRRWRSWVKWAKDAKEVASRMVEVTCLVDEVLPHRSSAILGSEEIAGRV
jgi:hypothetical protein